MPFFPGKWKFTKGAGLFPFPSQELGEGEQRGYQALFIVNEMVNLCDPSDPRSFSKAQSLARNFFSQRNGQSQHIVHAMGHCHIDSGLNLVSYYYIELNIKMCVPECQKLSST